MNALRLFRQHGQPTATANDRDFLRDLERFDDELEAAELDLRHALLHDDPMIGARAARRYHSLSYLICEKARAWERRRT